MATSIADEMVKITYGSLLRNQGKGYYVTLELLAIVKGTKEANGDILPSLSDSPTVNIIRRSHDYIRRILFDPSILNDDEIKHLEDATTLETLQTLFNSLRVMPQGSNNNRRTTNWGNEHLFPYVGELIHYDAVNRKVGGVNRPKIEQYRYRGAGGLAHKILRSDKNTKRLCNTRAHLEEMIGPSDTALGKICGALLELDQCRDEEPIVDEKDKDAKITHETKWVELLRSGVNNIVSRTNLVASKRFESLMHWVPFCIALHQLEVATTILQSQPIALPIDCRTSTNPIRQKSQQAFNHSKNYIFKALEANAQKIIVDLGGRDPERENEINELLEQKTQSWRKTCRAFFSSTLADIGFLNALKGRQHYSLKLPMIEAIVLAVIEPQRQVPFESFCSDILFQRLSLVIDEKSAELDPIGDQVDLTEFQENRESFAKKLRSLGMLNEFSDATRMVGGEVV